MHSGKIGLWLIKFGKLLFETPYVILEVRNLLFAFCAKGILEAIILFDKICVFNLFSLLQGLKAGKHYVEFIISCDM